MHSHHDVSANARQRSSKFSIFERKFQERRRASA